jgi:L-histidine Nalpha-methyltransferase
MTTPTLHHARSVAPSPVDDVLAGLLSRDKHLPCRLLYDARGAELFEAICELPEYYPTRSELALLEAHLPRIAHSVGPRARVVEPGSGAGIKTRMLLAALDAPARYVAIDISAEQLAATARRLGEVFPELAVDAVCADFTAAFELPVHAAGRTLAFFPGSTIGNFDPAAARGFLARLGELAGPDARLLLGADSNRDLDSLLRAYDDSAGVTAEFDRNVLVALNRSHGATFDPEAFLHRAVWNERHGRIEMHLVSRRRQQVTVAGVAIAFERGEPIITEHCYKHTPDAIRGLLAGAGWEVEDVFVDDADRMRLWLARR